MLEVFDISYRKKQKQILDHVSFRLRAGEFMAVLGSNGAGKSSLLRCLIGDWQADDGTMVFKNRKLEMWDAKHLAIERAYMAQHHPVNMPFNVFDIVAMGRYPYNKGRLKTSDLRELAEALKASGLWKMKDRLYSSLSGGEQQRVQLARVLAQMGYRNESSKLLLLDEPVNHLDMYHQHKMMQQAKDMAERGHAVLSVLHDVNMAALYADTILVLKEGKILAHGTPEEVISSELIREAYGYHAVISRHPIAGCPMVLINQQKTEKNNNAFVA